MFEIKKKELIVYCLCIAFLLIIRIPSFFGPQFSSDEGFYLSVGHSLSHGQLLYRDVWDNKPPLLYLLFALNAVMAGNSITLIRILGFVLSAVSIFAIYFLGLKVFLLSQKTRIITLIVSTLLYSFLFELTLLNAENIFVPLVLVGFLVLYQSVHDTNQIKNNIEIFTSGVFFALATWTKLNALPEIMILVAVYFIIKIKNEGLSLEKTLAGIIKKYQKYLVQLIILSSPIILIWTFSFVFFVIQNSINEFTQGIVGFSGSYLSYADNATIFGLPISYISPTLTNSILTVFLFILSTYMYLKTRVLDHSSNVFYLIVNWASIGVYCIFLSSRGYPHYFQQALPMLILSCALIGAYISKAIDWKIRLSSLLSTLIILNFVLNSFTHGSGIYNWFSFNTYYGGFANYVLGNQTYKEWNTSFDSSGARKRDTLIDFINSTKRSDVIYYVGSSPELYAYTKTYPGYRLIVDYHIDPSKELVAVGDTLVYNETTDVYVNSSSGIYNPMVKILTDNQFSLASSIPIDESTSISHYNRQY